ncbi:cadherin-related family member 2 isoform X2 [Hyla sarda]|nr:cadherin-related family member 2 isoform X2 [Hyla sarda]XP_056430685.1 cadherin-related family member 2 isoform X2 [Hyla sarda]XP_056430686.1 cadherin-related family member 2 isoform X2 [Hyla sarda]XP_056430689.1 cadherin-related family member 2 isoform X2 [Hyla sarda]XP_056430690.1 cadherin-related family member 2 isoform X2 [Hyla sarda]
MIWILCLLPFLLINGGGQVSANNKPVIEGSAVLRLPEDTLIGSVVYTILATDKDGDSLEYGLTGTDSFYFSCNKSNGELTLILALDYETKKELLVIQTVTDGKESDQRTLSIQLRDSNDNAPVFYGLPYAVEVPENTGLGTVICKVTAEDYDNDRFLPVMFSIQEVIPSSDTDLFYISAKEDPDFKIAYIKLNGTLDFNEKSTFYQLIINATDQGGLLHNTTIYQSTIAYVSVRVRDVPDLDPEFIGAPYMASVLEHAPLGQSVLKVSAVDVDRGIGDVIQYYIESSPKSHLFHINGMSGEIHVAGDIDREVLLEDGEQVILQVVAQERMLNIYGQNATANTSVTIRIVDVNDNKPQFYNCDVTDCDFTATAEKKFFGEIEEHSSVRVPVANLTITAHDPDKDQNGAFILYLRGHDADSFTVSPQTIVNTGLVQILVKDPAAIDYEKVHQMEVEVVANDTGLVTDCCSFAIVTINLIDINDHSPVFADATYKLAIEEHCNNGSVLGTITATDPDSGDYGRITYSFLPESILNLFQVNPSNGTISVVDGDLLDRERTPFYYATLRAQDGMNATGTTLLEIELIDINDCAPIAIGVYNIFVNENTDDIEIQLEATDNDEPGNNNSVIEYEILPSEYSGNFSINVTTGLITSLGPLDREAINISQNGRIVLTVKLYDLGVPSLSDNVSVTINVEDLNDNGPIFNQTEYTFFVNESTPGAYVGNVIARDKDQTELNNRISFSISQGGSGNFIIRGQREALGEYLGVLTLSDPYVQLNYEVQKSYTLIIEAEDNGIQGVSNTANATVLVHVLDLNDEPPSINPSSLVDLYLFENRTGGPENITTLVAIDPDTVHELEFQTLAMSCFKNGKDVGNICYDWLWLAPNGQLFVNHTEEIDYEVCDLMVMLLRVEDKLTFIGNRYSQNVSQRVVIQDVNDNAPEFLDINDAFVVIPETAVINTEVASVAAQDKDSGENAILSFSIDKVEFILSSGGSQSLGNIFSVTTTSEDSIYTGSVRVASNLDRTLKGQYKVTVKVVDRGVPSLSATRSITIFTIDESYRVVLRFSKSVDELTENVEMISRQLAIATGSTVRVAGIESAEASKRDVRAGEQSILTVYCVYTNGTAITPDELTSIIQANSEALANLLNLGLYIIGSGEITIQDDKKTFIGIIAGLAAFVALIIIIMISTIVCMRKSHARKIRAIKASKVAKSLPGGFTQEVEAIPGTNKFNAEGANPILNIELDLGLDMSSSSSDSASVNSDYNNILEKKDVREDASFVSKDSGHWEEPLAAALNDRENMSYSNMALDTTDL